MSLLRRLAPPAVIVSLCTSNAACLVSRAQYDECVQTVAHTRAAAESRQTGDSAQIQGLTARLAAAESATQDRDAKLSELSTSGHNLQAQLDEATAMNQQLRGELSHLGQDVDKVLAERGTLSKALDDAKSRLEELRKAQAAAEEHAQVFREFAERFKPLIGAGQLRVESRRGRMVMNVNGDLLFDDGKADIRGAGKGVLMELARSLISMAASKPGRRFLVTAHVDAEPLKVHHFKSSWDLTAARAVAVVDFLVSLHVPAEVLGAAAGGAFDPLVANDSPDSRAKNRRLEIALVPTEQEVVGAVAAQ